MLISSSVYCKRVSCLGMHINSLEVFSICMEFWFILCPRHVESFSTFLWGGAPPHTFFGIYYLFTFNNCIYISGIWNLNNVLSLLWRTFLIMAPHFLRHELRHNLLWSEPGTSPTFPPYNNTLFSTCFACEEATLLSWLNRVYGATFNFTID